MSNDAENLFNTLASKRTKAIKPEIEGTTAQEPPSPRKRPKGKRSDPTYEQVGAYIPKELSKKVKRLLVDEDIDFSELVAQLLDDWAKRKTD